MKKLNLFLLLLIFSSGVFAQDSTSITDITNGLGFVNGTKTIRKGSLYTRVGYSRSKVKRETSIGTFKGVYQNLPKLNLGYGLGSRIDLRMGLGFSHNTWESVESSGSNYIFSGLNLGTKINVFHQKGWIPEVAVDVGMATLGKDFNHLSIPTSLTFKYYLADRFDVSGSVWYTNSWSSGYHHDLFRWSMESSFDITKNLGVYASVRTWNPKRYEVYWNTGLFYQVNNTFLLNLEYTTLGSPFWSSYNNSSRTISAGFSWLMLNN